MLGWVTAYGGCGRTPGKAHTIESDRSPVRPLPRKSQAQMTGAYLFHTGTAKMPKHWLSYDGQVALLVGYGLID